MKVLSTTEILILFKRTILAFINAAKSSEILKSYSSQMYVRNVTSQIYKYINKCKMYLITFAFNYIWHWCEIYLPARRNIIIPENLKRQEDRAGDERHKVSVERVGRSGWKNAFLGAIYQRDTRVRADHEQRLAVPDVVHPLLSPTTNVNHRHYPRSHR